MSNKAYSVVSYRDIADQERMAAYAELAGPAIIAAGGRFVARDVPAVTLEGNRDQRVVIIEFENVEAAKAAYYSDMYQRALQALGDAAVRDYRIVPACA